MYAYIKILHNIVLLYSVDSTSNNILKSNK